MNLLAEVTDANATVERPVTARAGPKSDDKREGHHRGEVALEWTRRTTFNVRQTLVRCEGSRR